MTSVYALKEWDAQVQALTSGRTALLLRKGGILETHAGFEVEHREFLLYPTFLHQNPQELRTEFQPLLRPDPRPGVVELPALARVVGVWRVEDLARAQALEGLQALDAQAIARRFQYRNRPWLHAVLLEVSRFAAPLRLTETPEMLGCVSWVPLGPTAPNEAVRVLSKAEVEAVRLEVERRLS